MVTTINIDPGSVWVRIHLIQHKDSTLNPPKEAQSRYDDINKQYAVIYFSESLEGAFLETLGRNMQQNFVTIDQLKQRMVTYFAVKQNLNLVDLTGSGLRQIGFDSHKITSNNYNVTQEFSRKCFERQEVSGIYYRSRLNPEIKSIALFDRAISSLTVVKQSNLFPISQELTDILNSYNFALL